MADPVSITCPSTCTVTVVHELSLPPLQLTASEGAQIAVAILAIWAIAYGFRALVQMLKKTDGESSSESE
ncbi:hypothetical protein [Comamonas granuli]|uniref:hypothetical protein n=1 Tax=Comamonas granuli TaxID=290309 RepID=UPI0012EC88E8|nr:hypothetical protein [Comamonas granuli]